MLYHVESLHPVTIYQTMNLSNKYAKLGFVALEHIVKKILEAHYCLLKSFLKFLSLYFELKVN